MKRILLAIAVIASFASCEKQAAPVAVGSVVLKTTVDNSSVGKKGTVDQGTIPLYVSAINVNTDMGGLTTDTRFELVPDGTGDATDFVINDIPLGPTTFTAVTEPYTSSFYRYGVASTWWWSYSNIEEMIDLANVYGAGIVGYEFNRENGKKLADWLKDRFMHGYYNQNENQDGEIVPDLMATDVNSNYKMQPYAIYTGRATGIVNEDTPTDVNINMTTNYGRSMITIRPENVRNLKDVWVRATIDNGETIRTIVINSNKPLHGWYWSNENSIDGAPISIKLDWLDPSSVDVDYEIHNGHYYNPDFNMTVLKSQNVEGVSIVGGKSIWTDIRITESAFETSTQGLTFDFVEIDDETNHVDI